MSDGRFACGMVVGFSEPGSSGATVSFIAGLIDWVGTESPTSDAIAGAPLLGEVGFLHVGALTHGGCRLVGHTEHVPGGVVQPGAVSWYWADGSPIEQVERHFVAGDPPPDWERRDVGSPLTRDMLAPFESPNAVVQFDSRLTDADFETLGDWLADQPDVVLRAYGSYDDSITDLEFLRHFPNLRRFAVDCLYDSLESLDGLRHLRADLEGLVIGQTRRRLDLSVVARFGELRTLYLEGQTKGLDVLSTLTALEELTLRSITLPDLSLLAPLHDLRALELKLGGTSDLDLLPAIGRLEYLELWMIKGLTDIEVTAKIPTLRFLFLQSLTRVEQLPSMRDSSALRRVHLETMKGLSDLRPIADAPALESLLVLDCNQFRPEDFEPFVGHPTLREALIGTGSVRRNTEIRSMLGVAEAARANWRDVSL